MGYFHFDTDESVWDVTKEVVVSIKMGRICCIGLLPRSNTDSKLDTEERHTSAPLTHNLLFFLRCDAGNVSTATVS